MKRDMPERRGRTVLAFDFGLKRIGIAVGEPELRTAHPLGAVTRFEEVESLVAEQRRQLGFADRLLFRSGGHSIREGPERALRAACEAPQRLLPSSIHAPILSIAALPPGRDIGRIREISSAPGGYCFLLEGPRFPPERESLRRQPGSALL